MTMQVNFRGNCNPAMTENAGARRDVECRAERWIHRIRNVVRMCQVWRESFQGHLLNRNGSRRVHSMLAALQAKVDSLSRLLDRYAQHPQRLEPEHAQVFEERVEALVRYALQLDRVVGRSRRVSFDPVSSILASDPRMALGRLMAS
jgi:hypothetical protein